MILIPIENYIKYSINKNGEIYSNFKNKFLKPRVYQGYAQVALYNENKESKEFKVHRLVAKTFILNPLSLPCVNHKDGNKLNNNVENLEWVTNSENDIHAFKTGLRQYNPSLLRNKNASLISIKFTDENLIEIKKLSSKLNQKELANKFNVCRQTISNLLKVGYKF